MKLAIKTHVSHCSWISISWLVCCNFRDVLCQLSFGGSRLTDCRIFQSTFKGVGWLVGFLSSEYSRRQFLNSDMYFQLFRTSTSAFRVYDHLFTLTDPQSRVAGNPRGQADLIVNRPGSEIFSDCHLDDKLETVITFP